jgi:L-threonylcarbamoyladenylate synthase
MEIIRLERLESKNNKIKVIKAIMTGKIIIYPTDTIYGIGCNALNEASVSKIRDIKERDTKPFSVIAPSKKWIYSNFKVNKSYIEKLPGPFTFILKPIKKGIVAKNVNLGVNTLGVRIPGHKFTEIIEETKVPFVTTSVNVSGKKPITSIEQIPRKMEKAIDLAIDAGELKNNPSTVIDLTGKIARIVR